MLMAKTSWEGEWSQRVRGKRLWPYFEILHWIFEQNSMSSSSGVDGWS